MYRYVFGDGRKDTIAGIASTLDELENVITECVKTNTTLLNDTDKYIIISRLHSSLKGIIENPNHGLCALTTTYSGDAVCLAHLESLTERTHLICKDLYVKSDDYRAKVNLPEQDLSDN